MMGLNLCDKKGLKRGIKCFVFFVAHRPPIQRWPSVKCGLEFNSRERKIDPPRLLNGRS
jgi:hypothetical protein